MNELTLFISTFLILITVAISDIIARLVPKISSTYINVILGVIVALIPALNKLVMDFQNEVFMILILAPLLFFEGQRTPVQLVGKRIKSIVGTAIILAIISAFVAAGVLHLTFAVPMSLALVIVSISTPTDATALESVTQGLKFRNSVKKPLKMESLFNDATGLILLQGAIIWVNTGRLQIWHNGEQLFIAAGGGILLGIVLALLIMFFRQFLVRSKINVISSQTLIYLLTPFIVYWVAEKVGVSGIIAVVIAGLVNNSEAARSRFSSPRQMHLGVELVNFASNVLNSFVFVILGINLGRIAVDRYKMITTSLNWLMIGIVSYLVLLICRYIYGRLLVGDKSNKSAILFSFGGVHGTVTLAMTFSVMGNGLGDHTFALVILVETVVIILSMLVPTILFKIILPEDWDEKQKAHTIEMLRNRAVQVGIKQVKKMNLSDDVKDLVIYDLKDQMRVTTFGKFLNQWKNITFRREVLSNIKSVEQRRALMQAFSHERDYLYHMAKNHIVDSNYVYEVYTEVLLSESLVLDPDGQMI